MKRFQTQGLALVFSSRLLTPRSPSPLAKFYRTSFHGFQLYPAFLSWDLESVFFLFTLKQSALQKKLFSYETGCTRLHTQHVLSVGGANLRYAFGPSYDVQRVTMCGLSLCLPTPPLQYHPSETKYTCHTATAIASSQRVGWSCSLTSGRTLICHNFNYLSK